MGKSNVPVTETGIAYRIESNKDGAPVIHFEDEPIHMSAQEYFDAEPQHETPSEDSVEACGDWLKRELAGGPVRTAELEARGESQGFKRRVISRAAKHIRADRKPDGLRGPWVYALQTPGTPSQSLDSGNSGKSGESGKPIDSFESMRQGT
jgi:hypothetical protein